MMPLAVSMGEPQGVGPDIILTLFARRQALDLPAFAVFGDPSLFDARARRLGLDLAIAACGPAEAPARFREALPVVPVGPALVDHPGTPDPKDGQSVIAAIEAAVASVRQGRCRAIVTAPLAKAVLYDAGFAHPGHTEFLAALAATNGRVPRPVMMLAHENYRTVPATIHIPLKDVPRAVTQELIVETVEIVARDLAGRFGIASPRIAVAGLNPHAGEDGKIGTEDEAVTRPAVAALRAAGIDAIGPLPADTLFFPAHWVQYDCVVAMYHDQALIPIKTLAFDAGVNVTLGLPFVRTSPDHGTAFALAGTGRASDASMLAALRLADRMSRATT
ncbi:MAG: 4-hydroxythreonine-4-phosphate dehydrogenase PdxA [Alphaproteobacteria bacterium]|nr:4-hydroxythreonine-4-phosphate dehydrogenase PdxA [Alphaproteobacteria bacterium]